LGYLRVLIHCLMPTFREPCSSLHQGEEQPDTFFPCLMNNKDSANNVSSNASLQYWTTNDYYYVVYLQCLLFEVAQSVTLFIYIKRHS